jgi:hypothetical protein
MTLLLFASMASKQKCHPDRSVAQWRDLLWLFLGSHTIYGNGLH